MLGATSRRAGAIGHRGASARGARVEAADGSSRIALACCLLIATAIPLAFDPRGYFIFLPIKWTVAAALVFAGLGSAVWRHGLRRTRFLWGGALLAVLALASFAGIAPLTSLIGSGGRNLGLIAWLTFAGAFWLGATAGSGAGSADRVAFAAAAASIPVSLYAILQAAGVDPIAWREGIDLSRARSTLGNASFLGGYLVLVLPVAARLALDADRETPIRLLNGGAALLGLAALLATQTRGAWLGAATAAVLLVAAERRRLWASTALSACWERPGSNRSTC